MKLISIAITLLTLSSMSFGDVKLATKEVLLDNDAVEVVRVTYPAGSETGMHTHVYPHRVVYFVTAGTLEIVPEDKSKQSNVISAEGGKTLFLPAATHNVRNIGDAEVVLVETEIKPK